ncbi:MAG: type II toxin-antitoxin system RelE/ParE family toxin [Novosphingobium sp.]|nr:type II toxin-antitoxin system RelE/ParE family toxin [Novosphingobium sp.]
MAELAAGTVQFKDMGALYTGLRMLRCQHHYIFCLPRDAAPALVVAILHERMDLMTRLAARLG